MVQEKSVILCYVRFFAKQESARRNGIESKRIPALLIGSKNAAPSPCSMLQATQDTRRAEEQKVRMLEDQKTGWMT